MFVQYLHLNYHQGCDRGFLCFAKQAKASSCTIGGMRRSGERERRTRILRETGGDVGIRWYPHGRRYGMMMLHTASFDLIQSVTLRDLTFILFLTRQLERKRIGDERKERTSTFVLSPTKYRWGLEPKRSIDGALPIVEAYRGRSLVRYLSPNDHSQACLLE